MDRRTMLTWAVRAIGAATALMVGIPSFIAGFAPLWRYRPRKNEWRSIGAVDDFPVGEMRKVVVSLPDEPWGGGSLREQAIYAWRPSGREMIVYSCACTDLGCPLTFDEGSQCFFCPCHGGIFDKNGARMAGPPPRPMDRYANRIVDGMIMIDLNSVPPAS